MGRTVLGDTHKKIGYDHSENGQHQPHQHHDKQKEHNAGIIAHELAAHISDAPPLFTNAHNQRTKVMNSTHKNGSEDNPEARREPPPVGGHAGTNDGRRTGDGSEMMTKKDVLFRGNVIHIVPQFMSRDF